MIKRNPFGSLLAGVLLILVLSTAMLAYTYVRSVGEVRRLQYQNALINRNRAVAKALAQEALNYSATHPDIEPLLEASGIRRSGSSSNSISNPNSPNP